MWFMEIFLFFRRGSTEVQAKRTLEARSWETLTWIKFNIGKNIVSARYVQSELPDSVLYGEHDSNGTITSRVSFTNVSAGCISLQCFYRTKVCHECRNEWKMNEYVKNWFYLPPVFRYVVLFCFSFYSSYLLNNDKISHWMRIGFSINSGMLDLSNHRLWNEK